MPPARSFAITLSYGLPKPDDREAIAGGQDKGREHHVIPHSQ